MGAAVVEVFATRIKIVHELTSSPSETYTVALKELPGKSRVLEATVSTPRLGSSEKAAEAAVAADQEKTSATPSGSVANRRSTTVPAGANADTLPRKTD